MNGTARASQNRSGIRSAAQTFAERIREITRNAGHPENEAIIYVLGEPAVVFHLRGTGLSLVAPVQNLACLDRPQPRPTFVVLSQHAIRSEEIKNAWFAHRSPGDLLNLPPVVESDLVRFDESEDLSHLRKTTSTPSEIWWWHVRS